MGIVNRVAKHKRKQAKGKPITNHQLFPAVVALWFGALFGLGSLAVRPSLLEGLVLKSHIDLVVPAAAPPLGVTARILVALAMAVLGVVIGVAFARRIARPKPVATERKRSGRELGRKDPSSRAHYADTSVRPPVLASDDLHDPEDAGQRASLLANRRRALAIEHEEMEFVPHDFAPLPGGSPQVFDISEIHIDEVLPSVAAAPTDQVPSRPQSGPAKLDWSNAAPATVPYAAPEALPVVPVEIDMQRQMFQAESSPVAVEMPEPCPATAAAHADGRQVFGMAPPPPQPEAARQIFGASASDGHVSQELVKAAGYKTSVFEQEEAQPLFAPRPASPAEVAEAPQVGSALAPTSQAFEPAPAPIPQANRPAPDMAPATPEPQADASPPSPNTQGLTDLAARLAESMRRRRAARSQAAAQPVELGEPPATPIAPAIPSAYEVPAVPGSPAPQPAFHHVATAAAVPASPAFEAIAVQFDTPQQPFAAPQPAAPAAEPVSAAHALPRAMQPLALDAFIEEDAVTDPSLLPPRHIAMPVAPTQVPAAPVTQAPLELGTEDELNEATVSEDNFGSLLAINSSRNSFVRIEEPEIATDEVEPVVIFPGQAPAQVAPFAAASEQAAFRRFDAPGAAGQGQPVVANNVSPAVGQGEADQALRAALANLQRMSGAA